MGWGGRFFEAGRLLTFSAFRMGAYSRWALIRGWALIRINTVNCRPSFISPQYFGVYLGIKTCELFLCFPALCFLGSIVLTSLFSVCFTSPGEFESTGSYTEDEKYFTGSSDSICGEFVGI